MDGAEACCCFASVAGAAACAFSGAAPGAAVAITRIAPERSAVVQVCEAVSFMSPGAFLNMPGVFESLGCFFELWLAFGDL